MSQDELKRDVNRIFTLATTLAQKDGLSLSSLRDPELSRRYLGRAVTDYAEFVGTPGTAAPRGVNAPSAPSRSYLTLT